MAVSDPLHPAAASAELARQLAGLHGVARTAIISLLARHLATTRPDPLVTDPAATALCERLGLSLVRQDWTFQAVEAVTAIRTVLLDEATAGFAHHHRGATIVTLGAGLCTRHRRLPTLPVNWLDIDLPEVAALCTTLLPPGGNRTIVAQPLSTAGWRESIDASRGVLFILEGLTMYLAESEVRELVTDLATRFPGSELLIETVGPRPRQHPSRYRYLADTARPQVQFTWGVRDHQQIARWHPALRLVDIWHLMDHHPQAWPTPLRIMRRFPGVRNQAKIGRFAVQP